MSLARLLFFGVCIGCCSACTDAPGGSNDGDYGAAIVAAYVSKAQESCAAIHESDLYACSQVDRSLGEARRDAMTALDTYETFQRNCSEDRGKTKCDDMFNAALASAKAPAAKH